MDTYMVVLRIVHIVAGVFWVGAVLLLIGFIAPTARELGPPAAPFVAHLAGKKRITEVILTAAGLTVLAGLLMYWRVSGGLDPDWLGTAHGLTLTIGAICGIVAFVIGLTVVRPTNNATLALGREIAEGGGPPTPEQAARMQALGARGKATGRVLVPLLLVAVAAMASARYV
jgi:putative copper export protein